jgi:ribonuclease P protein subunit POP4
MLQAQPASPEQFIEAFLSSRVDSRKMKGGLLGQLRLQTMLLNPPYKTPKVTTPYRPPKKLSSRRKREMKIYEIPKEKQVYELYLPLHELWLSYMRDLLQVGPGKK